MILEVELTRNIDIKNDGLKVWIKQTNNDVDNDIKDNDDNDNSSSSSSIFRT